MDRNQFLAAARRLAARIKAGAPQRPKGAAATKVHEQRLAAFEKHFGSKESSEQPRLAAG